MHAVSLYHSARSVNAGIEFPSHRVTETGRHSYSRLYYYSSTDGIVARAEFVAQGNNLIGQIVGPTFSYSI